MSSVPVSMPVDQTNLHLHNQKPKDIDQYYEIAKKVAAVVVGVFAFYNDMALFCAAFVVGAGIGFYQKVKDVDHCKHGGDSCSQGMFEQLTAVKLPKVIELVGGVAVLLVHIDHHPSVFIPLSGMYYGAKISKLISP